MITFATLFLGLVLGHHDVQVVVGDQVARVEIVLNGSVIGTATGEPWSASCDFGDTLSPGDLQALAFNAQGQEVGRARQWINLPRDPAAATVLLGPHEKGKSRLARLSWQSLEATDPISVAVWLDGEPVPVEDPRAILLPPHDIEQLHFFRAELEFSDNIASVVELTFGGTYTDTVNTEITAIPVRFAGKRKDRPPLHELQGLFVKRGETLEVVAAEKGPAEIVVVMNGPFGFPSKRAQSRHRLAAPLPFKTSVRFVYPVPERRDLGVSFDLFPVSQPITRDYGGLYWILSRVRWPGFQPEDVLLSEAVAVAGVAACQRRRRRAVVLVLSGEPGPVGQLAPEQTICYLETLRVPFYLWTPDLTPAEAISQAWGEAVDVSSVPRLGRAAKKLEEDLESQWIVWLDGIHLPQEISLSSQATGIELVR